MRIEVDVLDYTMGGVLSMEYKNKRQRPVAFLSKSLNETKRNYEVHDKEMLAVIRDLENWRHLLEEAKFKFEVYIDHKNLEYFMKAQKLNRRQACWVLYLSKFDFILKHVSETKMEKVDVLSRRLNQKVRTENNNSNQTLIKDHQICNLLEVVIEGPNIDIIEKIKIARDKDKEMIRVVE